RNTARNSIPEPKPALAAERADAFHERPGLVTPAPAGGGIIDARESVSQRVDIGRDAQSKMLEIVSGVGDHEQFVARQDEAQTERQFRTADPAGQRHDQSFAHRNMSSAGGRTSSDAALSGPRHVRPRTITTGWPSAPCPITSDAAAAISSACPVTLTWSARPNRSGEPRRSISDGRPAAPIATPQVPRRQ